MGGGEDITNIAGACLLGSGQDKGQLRPTVLKLKIGLDIATFIFPMGNSKFPQHGRNVVVACGCGRIGFEFGPGSREFWV